MKKINESSYTQKLWIYTRFHADVYIPINKQLYCSLNINYPAAALKEGTTLWTFFFWCLARDPLDWTIRGPPFLLLWSQKISTKINRPTGCNSVIKKLFEAISYIASPECALQTKKKRSECVRCRHLHNNSVDKRIYDIYKTRRVMSRKKFLLFRNEREREIYYIISVPYLCHA